MYEHRDREIFYHTMRHDSEVRGLGVERVEKFARNIEDLASRYIAHYNHFLKVMRIDYGDFENVSLAGDVPIVNSVCDDEVRQFAKESAVGNYKMSLMFRVGGVSPLAADVNNIEELYIEMSEKDDMPKELRDVWCKDYLRDVSVAKDLKESGKFDEFDEIKKDLEFACASSLLLFNDYTTLSKSFEIVEKLYRLDNPPMEVFSSVRLSKEDLVYVAKLFDDAAEISAYSFLIDYHLLRDVFDLEDHGVSVLEKQKHMKENDRKVFFELVLD